MLFFHRSLRIAWSFATGLLVSLPFALTGLILSTDAHAQPTLLASSAAPGTEVPIAGLAEDLERPESLELRATIRAEGFAPYSARVVDIGGFALRVPVHPNVLTGGEVSIDFLARGQPIGTVESFFIQGVPRSQGSSRRVLDLLQQTVALAASHYGLGAAALQQPLGEIPIQAWSAAILQEALDDPAPTGLPTLLGGSGEIRGEPVDVEVVDALAGLFQLEHALQQHLNGLAALGTPPDPISTVRLAVGSRDPRHSETSFVFASGRQEPSDFRFASNDVDSFTRVEIRTAANLSWYMKLAEHHRQSFETTWLKVLGQANDLAGTIPHPAAQVPTLAISAALFVYLENALIQSLMLPSSLSNPRANFSKDEFLEDDPVPGDWEGYKVWASSKRWDPGSSLGQGIIELGLTVDGVRGAGVGDWVDFSTGMAGVGLNNQAKASARRFGGLLGGTFGPYEWGPITLYGERWVDADAPTIGGASRLHVDSRRQTYSPSDVGSAAVRLRPRAGSFPPESNTAKAQLMHRVETLPIFVNLSPGARVVKPGAGLKLTATIQNALDTELEWSLDGPGHGVSLQVDPPIPGGTRGSAGQAAMLLFPGEVEVKKVVVRVASTSATGLRAPRFNPLSRERSGFYQSKKDEDIELPLVGSCAFDLALTSRRLAARESANNESARGPFVAQSFGALSPSGELLWIKIETSPFTDGSLAWDRMGPNASIWFQEIEGASRYNTEPSMLGLASGVPPGAKGSFPAWVNVYMPGEVLPNRDEDLHAYSTDSRGGAKEGGWYNVPFLPGTITITEFTDEHIEGVIEAEMATLDTTGLEQLGNSSGAEIVGRDRANQARAPDERMGDLETMFYDKPQLQLKFRAVLANPPQLGGMSCLYPLVEKGELSEELSAQIQRAYQMIQQTR